MKSDLEKMRDVMEQIHGANTGLRYSNSSRAGADMAARAHAPLTPIRRQAKESAPIITPTRMTARQEREALSLIGTRSTSSWKSGRTGDRVIMLIFAMVAIVGAYFAVVKVGDAWATVPVRAVIGAIAAPAALFVAIGIMVGLYQYFVETVIPALVSMAVIGGVGYMLVKFISG